MRSILIIFATVVLVAIGFFAYLWFQPAQNTKLASGPAPVAIAPATRPTEVPDPDRLNGGGPSEKIWVKSYDEHTGQLANEFRSDHFEPRKDGTVDVTEPDGKFYLGAKSGNSAAGQVMQIHGKSGKVVLPDSTNNQKGGQVKGQTSAAPTRGQLKDVILYLYDNPAATEPTLICTMDNASFDQETFRIQTESYEYNGKIIPADQVPVKVRGKDYDFDGRGLDVRWNERDRRLQSLEVAHGEKLVVKHPQAMRGMSAAPATAPSDAGARNEDSMPLAISRLSEIAMAQAESEFPLLASTDPKAAGNAISAAAPAPAAAKKKKPATAPAVAQVKIVRDKTAPIFRATFFDNVKIVQNDQTLGTAKQMDVDFVMEQATTQPSTEPSTEPASPQTSAPQATAAPAAKSSSAEDSSEPKSLATVARAAKSHPTTVAAAAAPAEKKKPKHPGATTEPTAVAAAPTSQPTEAPVTIFWTGPLRVTPLDAETQDPPTKEDSIVTLEGEPVTLTRGGGHAECALFRFRTEDSSVKMESSRAVPLVLLMDQDGSVLRTPSVDYNGTEGVAVLRGQSHADIVLKNESTTQPSTMPPTTQPTIAHANWTDTCRLFMSGQDKQQTIDRAEIEGNVTITDPQIDGRSDTLELQFEQVPTTRPTADGSMGKETQLKRLEAGGKVHYVMLNEQKPQTLICNHLTLQTAKDQNNKLYARSMNADGNVHAFDPTQDLRCGQLAMQFQPSTRPSTEPSDPSKLDTSSIVIESLNADQNVHMNTTDGDSAKADSLSMVTDANGKREVTLVGHDARVQQKDDYLVGPVIKFDPDTNRAYVVGAGQMHGVQQPSPADQANTTKKERPQPMDLSWAGNLAADGDLNTIDIVDKIVMNAKTADGAINKAVGDRLKLTLMDDPKAATRPVERHTTKKTAQNANPLGDTNFFKDKVVKLVDLQDGVQLSSVINDSKGKLLRRMFMQAPHVQYAMQDRIFLVPTPGQMLMEDEGKAQPDTASSDATPSDMHGATAFEWSKELRYDEGARQMTMTGDCHIEHQSSGDSKPFTLRCQKIVADMEPATPTTAPTTDASVEGSEPATVEGAVVEGSTDASASPTTAPAKVAAAAPTTQPSPTTTAPTTTASAKSPASSDTKMRLKHVTCTDQIEFSSLTIHFEATSLDYDPNTHILIARGTDRLRAQLYDDKGSVEGSFTEIHYNSQTGRIDEVLDFRATMRK